MLIYKATNLENGKVYVGQTKRSLEVRKKQHLYDASSCRLNTYFHKAIRKYGVDKFTWEIIAECSTRETLIRFEIKAIAYYKEREAGVYNLTDGGEGLTGYVASAETRRKIGLKSRRKRSKKVWEAISRGHGVTPFLVFCKHSKELVGKWNTYAQCARDLKIDEASIRKCLKGERKTAGRYTLTREGL